MISFMSMFLLRSDTFGLVVQDISDVLFLINLVGSIAGESFTG